MIEHGSLPENYILSEQTRNFVSLLLPTMSVGSVVMTWIQNVSQLFANMKGLLHQ